MVHALIRDTDVTIQFHPFPDFQCAFYILILSLEECGSDTNGGPVVLPLVVPISVICCALVTNLDVNDINNIHMVRANFKICLS